MVKSNPRVPSGLSTYLKGTKGESLSYRQVFEWIAKTIPSEVGVVTASMPRGGLQIVQPQRVPETLIRSYSREFNVQDRPSWTAIVQGKPVKGSDAFGNQAETHPYVSQFMKSVGLTFVAAAPLRAPVMIGFPGALVLFRTAEQGDFTNDELALLGEIARELDEAIDRSREHRQGAACEASVTLAHRPRVRQFVFDKDLKQRLPSSDLNQLDERIRQQMQQHAKHEFQHINGTAPAGDRLQLPDARGDLWVFRVAPKTSYPALTDGPVIFFNLQPAACEWGALRPSDFQADGELARLIPALKFMQEEFRRGPSLAEIAKTAHLSPFHFHRRFTELLGLTPKHFMLDCQIDEAKRMLVDGEKELSEIASICGFAHQSHFTSRFKQATGLTPTRWRKLAMDREKEAKGEPAGAGAR